MRGRGGWRKAVADQQLSLGNERPELSIVSEGQRINRVLLAHGRNATAARAHRPRIPPLTKVSPHGTRAEVHNRTAPRASSTHSGKGATY